MIVCTIRWIMNDYDVYIHIYDIYGAYSLRFTYVCSRLNSNYVIDHHVQIMMSMWWDNTCSNIPTYEMIEA